MPNGLWQVGTSTAQFEVEALQREPTTRSQQNHQLISTTVSSRILDTIVSAAIDLHIIWGGDTMVCFNDGDRPR